MNNVVCTGHLGRHRTDRNHRLLDICHRDIDHDHRPIAFGCSIDIGLHQGDNHCLVAEDPMTMDARYPYYGRIDARPGVSGCYEARSGELGWLSFG